MRGGIHMSLVVTMTTVTSARFFVAMTTFSMLTMMTSASHYCNDISGCGGQYVEADMLVYIYGMYVEAKFPIYGISTHNERKSFSVKQCDSCDLCPQFPATQQL